MLLIHCPYCEQDRPELEFAYAGEAHIARPADPSTLSDEEWRDFLFIRTNPRGTHFERWRHVNGCARFFNAVRDTVRDRFLLTYKAGQPRPDLEALTEREPRSDLEKLIATEPRPNMAATEGRTE